MEPIRRVVIVGDGGWGTALAMVLARGGLEVSLWAHDAEYAAHMHDTRTNPRYLPGFELPAQIRIGADLTSWIGTADLLVSAVPTAHIRAVWEQHVPLVPAGLPILSVSKGLEDGTLLRPTEVLAELTGGANPIAVLSGPNIAREIAAGLPATTVVAAADEALSRALRAAFSHDTFRAYSNADLVGVELGGVLKNIIALAAGMCDGMELGANAKASLVTRGMIEMSRLGVALGGRRETFFGLSGLGDLYTTCESRSSRNRTFGERLGRGERLDDIAASMNQVAEGVKSARPVRDIMHRHELALPISEEVYRVVHEGKSPREAVRALMGRSAKDEAADLASQPEGS
ncbi:MAG: NAD(P)-dependent glycerol-3-phosphate dehydrogenase [Planctomycetota bacterium]|nr:NAD(P)-dependent glycerol-3-phosphate dehydrogenase [Planctomycetota bacterium]